MLRGKRSVYRRKLVVVEAVNEDGKVGGNRKHVEAVQTHTMASVCILHVLSAVDNGGCGCGTHFFMTCSSVLTENFLYALNWCKLRQCCRGVSTSTRAWVGNQYSCCESLNFNGAKSISELSAFRPTSCKESAMPASIFAMDP